MLYTGTDMYTAALYSEHSTLTQSGEDSFRVSWSLVSARAAAMLSLTLGNIMNTW